MKYYLTTDELHWSATLDKKYPTESQKYFSESFVPGFIRCRRHRCIIQISPKFVEHANEAIGLRLKFEKKIEKVSRKKVAGKFFFLQTESKKKLKKGNLNQKERKKEEAFFLKVQAKKKSRKLFVEINNVSWICIKIFAFWQASNRTK